MQTQVFRSPCLVSSWHQRRLAALLFFSAALWGSWAQAAGSGLPEVGSRYRLVGRTLTGSFFDMSSQQGKVVLLYYWKTDCPVCLDKLPELRANAAGWLQKDKPFAIVMVNADKERAAAVDYWKGVTVIQPKAVQGPILWRGGEDFADSLRSAQPAQWPLSILLDGQGKVVARWEGRIPAEAWNKIADLLP